MAGETCPRWLLGKNTALSITPVDCDPDDGTLTADTGNVKSFIGKCDRFELRADPRMDEISPMDGLVEHDEIIKDRYELTVTELQKIAGSDLMALIMGGNLFLIVAVLGKKKVSFWCTRGSGTFNFEHGKSPATMQFRQIDTGQVNPLLEDVT